MSGSFIRKDHQIFREKIIVIINNFFKNIKVNENILIYNVRQILTLELEQKEKQINIYIVHELTHKYFQHNIYWTLLSGKNNTS